MFYSRFNNKEVLDAAKANVENYYSVVGVTEMFDETLEVLEHQLPFFFKGDFLNKIIKYFNFIQDKILMRSFIFTSCRSSIFYSFRVKEGANT